jgi:structural maintenance of chromosome 1
MAAEKKQYKEQKDEAERFQALLNQKAEVKVQQYLCQLYHVEQGLSLSTDDGYRTSIEMELV